MFQVEDLVTVGLLVSLEGLRSADNAMVLTVLVLGLPKQHQAQALRYGIVSAFIFRAIATLLALYLIGLGWVKLVGASCLLYLVYHYFGGRGSEYGATRSRTSCFSSFNSGKRSRLLRDQIVSPAIRTSNTPPVPETSAAWPSSSSNVIKSSRGIQRASGTDGNAGSPVGVDPSRHLCIIHSGYDGNVVSRVSSTGPPIVK